MCSCAELRAMSSDCLVLPYCYSPWNAQGQREKIIVIPKGFGILYSALISPVNPCSFASVACTRILFLHSKYLGEIKELQFSPFLFCPSKLRKIQLQAAFCFGNLVILDPSEGSTDTTQLLLMSHGIIPAYREVLLLCYSRDSLLDTR